MVSNNGEYALMPDVVLIQAQDGSARLLDLAGSFFALSDSATAMLTTALTQDVPSAAKAVADAYGVDLKQVRSDMESLLRSLERGRLVYRTAAPPPQRPTTPRLRARFVAGGLAAVACLPWLSSPMIGALLAFAYGCIHLLGWPAAVAAWQRHCPPIARRNAAASGPSALQAIDERLRDVAAAHWLKVGCKERALACWALLHWAGVDARIVVGIDLYPLSSHCWCVVGSRVLTDYEDRCLRFRPIVQYPPDGDALPHSSIALP